MVVACSLLVSMEEEALGAEGRDVDDWGFSWGSRGY